MKNSKLPWIAALVMLLIIGLYWNGQRVPTRVSPAAVMDIVQASREVVAALRARDGARLAEWVHPAKGLRFSPYAFVDVANDRVFSREQIRRFWDDRSVYVWGHAEGSGEPIALTPVEYWERYVLDRDYLEAASISVDADRARGNTANNAAEVYPQGTRVEYYVEPRPGEGVAEFDWSALRLVFENVDSRWLLIAVIHDQWTP